MIIKGWEGELPQPLTTGEIPRNGKLHSPRPGYHHDTPRPIYPGEAGFEDALYEVIEVREQVEHGRWPTEYLSKENPGGGGGTIPHLLNHIEGLGRGDPSSAANVVAMDRPSDLGTELFVRLWEEGVELNEEYLAENGNVPFVEALGQFSAQLGIGVYYSLEKIFDVKYYWMLERPETAKKMPGCVFTGDAYGAPNHPAYGAGHGAVAGMVLVLLKRFFKLTDDVLNRVLDACYQFAHWRTLLGVHYRADNDLGMAVGTSIIDKIPHIS